MITSFVMIIMLIIEYINVQSQGNWSKILQKSSWLQIIFAAILGVIPGCLGAFTIVSLYSHKIVNFAALVTVMIATSGDEAFVLFAMIPGTAIKLNIIIFTIAIFSGFIINIYSKKIKLVPKKFKHDFEIHKAYADCACFDINKIATQLRHITFERALLIISFVLFCFFLLIGEIGTKTWDWKRITFLTGSLITLFIIITVPDHFVKEHLWEHVIKRHLLKIFLWILGALIFINLIENHINIDEWVVSNQLIILLIAILIGIIPESGPHMVFITLFINGSIPFSILLANSIVQDGHGALPLIAESKISFVYVKLLNMLIGLIVGLIGFYMNW
ncbi:MAG: arsenic efflux protein [Bacteroidales bacterium]|nr:arsenic efflux protein [Bacteroidales bacterium]